MCAPERRRPLLKLNALLRSAPLEMLLEGQAVLRWDAYIADGLEDAEARVLQGGLLCDTRYAHVSYLHQRPFYVVVVPMAQARERDEDSIWLSQGDSPQTIYQWISSLDIRCAWDATVQALSMRHRAIEHICGEVCLLPEPACETSRVWSGLETESRPRRRGRRARPLHEVVERQEEEEEAARQAQEVAEENDQPGFGM